MDIKIVRQYVGLFREKSLVEVGGAEHVSHSCIGIDTFWLICFWTLWASFSYSAVEAYYFSSVCWLVLEKVARRGRGGG